MYKTLFFTLLLTIYAQPSCEIKGLTSLAAGTFHPHLGSIELRPSPSTNHTFDHTFPIRFPSTPNFAFGKGFRYCRNLGSELLQFWNIELRQAGNQNTSNNNN